jgi:hypothetical protein
VNRQPVALQILEEVRRTGDIKGRDPRARLGQGADILPPQPAQAAGDDGDLAREAKERGKMRVADR